MLLAFKMEVRAKECEWPLKAGKFNEEFFPLASRKVALLTPKCKL